MSAPNKNSLKEYFSDWELADTADAMHKAAERLVREHLELLIRKVTVSLAWDGNRLVANLIDNDGEFIHTVRVEKAIGDALPGTHGYVPLERVAALPTPAMRRP